MGDTIDSIMGTEESEKEKMASQFSNMLNALGSFRMQITAMQYRNCS